MTQLRKAEPKPSNRYQVEMAILPLFDGKTSKDENERINSRRVGIVGFDICVRRSGRCLKRKYDREFGNGNIKV